MEAESADEGVPSGVIDWAWDVWVQRLLEFPAREEGPAKGKRLVKIAYETDNGHKLGAWVESQRELYRAGELAPERVAQLESIGSVWDVEQSLFDEGAGYFEASPPGFEKESSAVPPPKQSSPQESTEFDMAAWLEKVRRAYQRQELSAARVARLEAAGIDWDPTKGEWEEGFAHFVAFEPDASGRRVVGTSFVAADGYKLGVWQRMQRQEYRAGDLAASRVARLEAAGIRWEPFEDAWLEGFGHFEALDKDMHGQRVVTAGYLTDDGYRLGTWLENQRQAYKRGALSPVRIEKLEGAGMVWDLQQEAWLEGRGRGVKGGASKRSGWGRGGSCGLLRPGRDARGALQGANGDLRRLRTPLADASGPAAPPAWGALRGASAV